MSDKMKTYFKNQARSESINIKPGLKEVATNIAADLFPCAQVSADDAIEYLISAYTQVNDTPVVETPPYNNYIPPSTSKEEYKIDEMLNKLYPPVQPVILAPREENIYDVSALDAASLNFKS